MTVGLKQQFPLRLLLGGQDATFLLDDGCTFSNVDPGGFEAASFQIPKDMPEALRGMNVRLECGLKVAWEGRISQVQRSLGNRTQIMCEGYGAMLKDDTASMVFVDRDLTHWQPPSYGRQIALAQLTGGDTLTAQVAADPANDLPALTMQFTQPGSAEAWYDAGPNNHLETVHYALGSTFVYTGGVSAPPGFLSFVTLSADQLLQTSVQTANLGQGASGYYINPAAPYRYAVLTYTPSSLANIKQDTAGWQQLAVYGNHGMLGRGGDPVGYYPSDIFNWTITQAGGLQPGVIVPTDSAGYIVPHAAYYTPVTLDTIIGDMAKIQGWHWGVWESLNPLTGNATPRVDFRPRPAAGAFTAFCLRRDCDQLDMREDLSSQYNQAVVNFTTAAGTEGVATVQLDNPILDQVGLVRTVVFSGGTMTQATATVFGLEALALLNQQARVAGSATIVGTVGMPIGQQPAWLLKAGLDRLRIGDLPSTDAWGARSDVPVSRVEASISTSGWKAAVEFGSGANLVETLQARLSAATTLASQGGT